MPSGFVYPSLPRRAHDVLAKELLQSSTRTKTRTTESCSRVLRRAGAAVAGVGGRLVRARGREGPRRRCLRRDLWHTSLKIAYP